MDGTDKSLIAELLRALADPKSPQGMMLHDLYVAEVFLSLDAAEDGATYFRDALKNAPIDAVRLNKAVLLSQFLLLTKKHQEYLDLVKTTLLPQFVVRDAVPAAKDENPLSQLTFFAGWQMAVLPLCDPEFVKSISREETQSLLIHLENLRNAAGNDRQRLWLDVMIQGAYQRLGQMAQADAAAKRIADNPEGLDSQHGKNAVALIAEVRQTAAQMEALRKMLQFQK